MNFLDFLTRRRSAPKKPASPSPEALLPGNLRDEWVFQAQRGHPQSLRDLLARHPLLLNARDSGSNEDLLSRAPDRQDSDFALNEILASATGIFPKSGRTALGHAAFAGQIHIVRLLLDLGADASIADNGGMDPLMLAAAKVGRMDVLAPPAVPESRQWELIELLLPFCDAKKQNEHGNTALIFTASQRFSEPPSAQALRALIAQSDPAAVDSLGCTALIWAVRFDNRPLVEALLGVSPMDVADNEDGLCAWEWALNDKNPELLDLMAAHPSSAPWREKIFARLRKGLLLRDDFPRSWALAEGAALREAIGGSLLLPVESTPSAAAQAPSAAKIDGDAPLSSSDFVAAPRPPRRI